jgi:DNA (cytosine-5)-methyltransferase 1
MQISLFDGNNKFKIDKPIRLIELFAGIGSQAKALKNLGVDFEHYRICEFDKYAVASYNAVHGTNFETSDITKITANDLGIFDTDKYCYIMTYSFPCQDLSNAGLGKGMAKGSGTRSGLLWEVERLLDECEELPNVLLMENVPQVIGTNNIQHFAKWQEKLELLGYKNKWQVLNAKDFGIPQNRERCFMVSILGDYYYDFPKTIPLTLRLKDMLENEVDEKYHFTDRKVVFSNSKMKETNTNKLIKVGYMPYGEKNKEHQSNTFYSTKGICPTIDTCGGGNLEPKIILKSKSQHLKNIIDKINIKETQAIDTYNQSIHKDFFQTIRANINSRNEDFICHNYIIRKLTPKECWRLMGFEDKDIDNAIAIGMSNAQLYKQAGNSIVVNVLMAIFKEML